jgi:hypothetical protein
MFGLNSDIVEWHELPVVDSKDSFPVETLLGCQYILIPSENQYFVAPQGQKILASVKACFDEKWPLAQDFKELPQTFALDRGLKVTVYERIRPSSAATAALTLTKMKAFVGEEPGSQPMWITTGLMSEICYDKKRSQWQFPLGIYRPGLFEGEIRYLLYCHDLPPSFTLSGKLIVSREAPLTTLRAQLLGEDGRLLDTVTLAGPISSGEGKEVPFSQSFASPQAKYLVLIVDSAPRLSGQGRQYRPPTSNWRPRKSPSWGQACRQDAARRSACTAGLIFCNSVYGLGYGLRLSYRYSSVQFVSIGT